MPSLDKIPQRQLDLGAAGFFRPEPETPPGNQVVVKAGFAYKGAFLVIESGDQTSAGFASVSGAGFKRYDLVYLDSSGVVQNLQGNEVAVAAPAFDGAPGFNLGPALPDQIVPTAYVLVDEPGAVTVVASDIFQITGFIKIDRDLDGYLVDKGLFGSPPAGASDVVTALFAGETPGGSATVRGVVTAPPGNYVDLLDQKGDQLLVSQPAGSPARGFGRLTEAAGVWTLTYLFVDSTGSETSFDPSSDLEAVPSDVRLVGVRKVFSRNDPSRPLFDSAVGRLSDQVVGDIPTATLTVEGKVRSASGAPAVPVAGVVNAAQNNGVPFVVGAPYHTLDYGSGGLTNPAPGVLRIPPLPTPSGKIIQQQRVVLTSPVSIVVATPDDATIPQFAEGQPVMQVSITPTSLSNILVVEWISWGAYLGFVPNILVVHLHRDSIANAIAANRDGFNSTPGTGGGQLALRHFLTVPTLSPQTYQLRAGTAGGTQTINGLPSLGGVALSTLFVTEYQP